MSEPCSKYINIIMGFNALLRAVVYLDRACIKIDDETFETNGLQFKVPMEWQKMIEGFATRAIEEIVDESTRLRISMVPISLVVLRTWVYLGNGMSPCVIYHVVKKVVSAMGMEIKEMKMLGEEYVVVKKEMKREMKIKT